MSDIPLTAEQEAEAQRIAAIVGQKVQEETLRIASKPDDKLLGTTEFEVRDRVHRLGAQAIETALQERKKGGTTGRASPARTVRRRRGS